jgi:hypothetical protein
MRVCARAKLNLLRTTTTNLYQTVNTCNFATSKKKLGSFISVEANYFRVISRYPPVAQRQPNTQANESRLRAVEYARILAAATERRGE